MSETKTYDYNQVVRNLVELEEKRNELEGILNETYKSVGEVFQLKPALLKRAVRTYVKEKQEKEIETVNEFLETLDQVVRSLS